MGKLSVSELLRLACVYAESYEEGFADAVGRDTDEGREAVEYVEQLRAYRMKRWGKTKLEAYMDRCESVTPQEAIRRAIKAGTVKGVALVDANGDMVSGYVQGGRVSE